MDDDEVFAPPMGFQFRPVHPEVTLAAEMRHRDWTANGLARRPRVSPNLVQANYDLAVAQRDLGATIEQEVQVA